MRKRGKGARVIRGTCKRPLPRWKEQILRALCGIKTLWHLPTKAYGTKLCAINNINLRLRQLIMTKMMLRKSNLTSAYSIIPREMDKLMLKTDCVSRTHSKIGASWNNKSQVALLTRPWQHMTCH